MDEKIDDVEGHDDDAMSIVHRPMEFSASAPLGDPAARAARRARRRTEKEMELGMKFSRRGRSFTLIKQRERGYGS